MESSLLEKRPVSHSVMTREVLVLLVNLFLIYSLYVVIFSSVFIPEEKTLCWAILNSFFNFSFYRRRTTFCSLMSSSSLFFYCKIGLGSCGAELLRSGIRSGS